jgi:hypothetical protein
MKYYVLLTGGKNNAGDFLIKYRAKKLLSELRPDRELKDFNAWEPFDDEKLEIVNNAEALLLTGGPALQSHMYPGVYKLTNNLDEIKVPIISMGIGWKSANGDWEDIYKYGLSGKSQLLVKKLSASGYDSSVRDYHTMHVLQRYGINNVIMTGCPALYDSESIGIEIKNQPVSKINFSLGVGFIESPNMEKSVKDILLKLKKRFSSGELSVLFHHSIDKNFLNTPDASSKLHKKNIKFAEWLDQVGISYEDISGSAKNLIDSYTTCDFHIGYRVHAHIFMSSISKPSILIAEDGRGKALRSLLGGIIFDGFSKRRDTFIEKAINKIGLPLDRYEVDTNLADLIIKSIDTEFSNGTPRLKSVRSNIDLHYQAMKKFIKQLP